MSNSENGYSYFYYLKNGKIDNERGIQRITNFMLNNFSEINKEEIKKANWFQKLFYWKDLDETKAVQYKEREKVNFGNQVSWVESPILRTSKIHYELLLKTQTPNSYFSFIGYKWSDLKDVPLHKRFGYMYHIDSEKKSSLYYDVLKLIIGAIIGSLFTYFIKD